MSEIESIIELLKTNNWDCKQPESDLTSYIFTRPDLNDPDCTEQVVIEDHRNEMDISGLDDWCIYVSYINPLNKDWFGHVYNSTGVLECKDLVLFTSLISVIKKGSSNE